MGCKFVVNLISITHFLMSSLIWALLQFIMKAILNLFTYLFKKWFSALHSLVPNCLSNLISHDTFPWIWHFHHTEQLDLKKKNTPPPKKPHIPWSFWIPYFLSWCFFCLSSLLLLSGCWPSAPPSSSNKAHCSIIFFYKSLDNISHLLLCVSPARGRCTC